MKKLLVITFVLMLILGVLFASYGKTMSAETKQPISGGVQGLSSHPSTGSEL
jgi:hypothetical protein